MRFQVVVGLGLPYTNLSLFGTWFSAAHGRSLDHCAVKDADLRCFAQNYDQLGIVKERLRIANFCDSPII